MKTCIIGIIKENVEYKGGITRTVKGFYLPNTIADYKDKINKEVDRLSAIFDYETFTVNKEVTSGVEIIIEPSESLISSYETKYGKKNREEHLEELLKIRRKKIEQSQYRKKNGESTIELDEDLMPKDSPKQAKKDYNELKATIESQIKLYNIRLTALNNEMKATTNIIELRTLVKRRDAFSKMLDALNEELNDATKVRKLEDLRSFAEKHIERVKALTHKRMSSEEITEVNRYIALWLKAGDFSTEENIFFTKKELESDRLKNGYVNKTSGERIKGFANYKAEMEELKRKLDTISKDRIVKIVNETLEKDYSREDILKAISDVNDLSTNTLDISRLNDPLVSAVYKITKRASFDAHKETVATFEKLEKLIKDVQPELSKYEKDGEKYDVFLQRDSFNRRTGNMVFRFSQEFFDEKNKLLSNARNTPKKHKSYKARWDKYFKWVKDNNITFDVRVLFPTEAGDSYHYPHAFEQGMKESLISELKKHLGEKGYELYYNKALEEVENFRLQYELQSSIMTKEELNLWEKKNSPYYRARITVDGTPIKHNDEYITPEGKGSIITVPRKYSSDGKITKWYDDNYSKIENNDKLLAFYEEYTSLMSTLMKILPEHLQKKMSHNTLMTVQKDIVEQMHKNGLKGSLVHSFDKMKEATRESDLTDTIYTETDAFGNPISHVQLHIGDNKKTLNSLLKLKIIKFKSENSRKPTVDEVLELKSIAMSELSNQKSLDLGKIMKAYASQVISYKYKSKTEDTLRLARTLMSQRKGLTSSLMGTPLLDSNGKEVVNGNLANYMKTLDNHLDVYYGKRTSKVEGVSNIKRLTSFEKKKKKELEEALENLKIAHSKKLITTKELNNQTTYINEQIDELGGVVTGNKIVSRVLSWVQLKGMSWNIPSAFANSAFGDIANLLQASDGRLFNTTQFLAARKITLGTVLKENGFTTDSKKMKAWMTMLDIAKDSVDEFSKHEKLFGGKLALLNPYELQKRSEYLVMSPVLVAMMMNRKVYKDGEESNLWQIADEFGNYKEGYSLDKDGTKPITDNFIVDFKIRVDQAIKKTHGNYDHESPILIKRTSIGKLVSQFKTWLYEGVAIRMEGEKTDHVLGIDTKGRYRSFGPALNSVENTLFTLKQLVRKVTFMGTEFDKKFSEVDAANMRANLTEIVILMNLYAVGMLLSGLKGDDEEDTFILNFLLNQTGRLQTDILLYSDPTAYEKLQSNIIPAASLIGEIKEWFGAANMYLEGKDILKNGPDKGDSRLFKKSMLFFPGTNSYLKLERSIDRTFNK